ncbi:MAG TPA: two-component system response regulator [Fibrobacteres bacterium]|jgi:putative two-component system response regulator|nr:two-component system response regulator [Fibrobacterota bacterium]
MKVLIVDDELISRAKLGKIVSSMGHSTIVACDGKEALSLWIQHRPDIVITDLVMPEMTGMELVKEIKRLQGSKYCYVIMITSHSETQDLVTGMEAGADDFIAKPFIKEELTVRIKAGERIINFESRDIVIFSMACLAEARDTDTGNHLERIRYYSKILAENIAEVDNLEQLTPIFIDNIFLTCPLHDIGKIGIPDFVLLKPGRLDDKEYKIMQKHTSIGFEALTTAIDKYPNAEYLKMSAEIAFCHHEKYDGSGYPRGIKGEEIPLSARIVALADVYDALVSKRVYKSAMPHDTARSIIISESGKHFDPIVVNAFLRCEQQFMEIMERYAIQ